jgi:beta-1,4-N-acetylglucosaminyltransferase
MKVCIVSSCGGHLTEVRAFKAAYQQYEHFYVLDDKAILPEDMRGKTTYVTHSERDWKMLLNLWEAVRILWKERPDVILSTGAGVVVSFAVVARLFFKTRVVFIETLTRVNRPSLTGRIMYRLAHDFFYQWESLEKHFPKGTFGGLLL